MKVFLGGTCNGSKWRNAIIKYLDIEKIDYFNPIVDDWNEEARKREREEREKCDICLYCITPKISGFYSIAEVADDSNKRPAKTILLVLKDYDGVEFQDHQWKSLLEVGRMVKENGGLFFIDIGMTVAGIKKLNRIQWWRKWWRKI